MQAVIAENEIQFHFHPEGCIAVEGKWELRDSSGGLLDASLEDDMLPDSRECFRVHKILGKTVRQFTINAPLSFSLYFDSGHVLTIFDDSKEYESFSIQPGDIYI